MEFFDTDPLQVLGREVDGELAESAKLGDTLITIEFGNQSGQLFGWKIRTHHQTPVGCLRVGPLCKHVEPPSITIGCKGVGIIEIVKFFQR